VRHGGNTTMAKDITGLPVNAGDSVVYIKKPWKGNQELKIGVVISTSDKSIVVHEEGMWNNECEYRIKEGRFYLNG